MWRSVFKYLFIFPLLIVSILSSYICAFYTFVISLKYSGICLFGCLGGDHNVITLVYSYIIGSFIFIIPIVIWWTVFIKSYLRIHFNKKFKAVFFLVFALSPLWAYLGWRSQDKLEDFKTRYLQSSEIKKMCVKDGLNIRNTDNSRTEVECMNGSFNGKYRRYKDNVVEYDATYKLGKLHGIEKIYNISGNLERELNYREGIKNGYEIYYNSNGSTSLYILNNNTKKINELYFQHPERNSFVISNESQKLMCDEAEKYLHKTALFTCMNGKFEGTYKAISAVTGEVYEQAEYHDGILDGATIKYENGKIKSYVEYKNGKIHGFVYEKEISSNTNTIVYKGQYVDGLQEGVFSTYKYNGAIVSVVMFRKGKIIKIDHPK